MTGLAALNQALSLNFSGSHYQLQTQEIGCRLSGVGGAISIFTPVQ